MGNNSYNISKILVAGLLGLSALTLGGCVSDEAFNESGPPVPVHASDRYPITLQKGPQTMEISAAAGHLTPDQLAEVQGFAHQAVLARAGTVSVVKPAGGGKSSAVASEIAAVLIEQGVPRRRLMLASYSGPAGAPVRAGFVATYASAPPCGDWSTDLTDTTSNGNYPNLGCAVQNNIAAMIDDPSTVETPRTVTIKQSNSAVFAVQRENAAVNSVILPNNYSYSN
jgi:pilus assembly protein CpaD